MTARLLAHAVGKFLAGAALMALLLFLPAGTAAFPRGWLLMGVLLAPMPIAGAVMMARKPELLAKRLNMRESRPEQRRVIAQSAAIFAVGFVLAGLDARFGWTRLPVAVSIAAAVILLLGYALYARVLMENAYLSRTVEIQAGQRVVDTGPYAVVRHPMYSATLLIFLCVPLVLGSGVSLAVFLAYPAVLAARIGDEEAALCAGLEGYAEYCDRVIYRLIPHVW